MTKAATAKKAEARKAETEEMRLVTTRGVRDAPLPVTYERAKKALAVCARADECRTWKKKALALASYARQAQDETLMNMAVRIAARATQRCGQLLKELDKRAGRHTGPQGLPSTSDLAAAAKNAGLSEREKVTALRIASIPSNLFEAAVESENPPTITALAEMGTAKKPPPAYLEGRDPKDFNRSLHMSAAIIDLATKDLKNGSPEELIRGCIQSDYADLRTASVFIIEYMTVLLKGLPQ